MNKINYQKLLDETLKKIESEDKVPALLLHSCCAPCSSYVIEYLSKYFYITVFYYNPNIDEKEEYLKRANEQQQLIAKMPTKYPVKFLEGSYDVDEYTKIGAPLAHEKEGGARCFLCYEMRLKKTAETAKEQGFDYFTTTLSISPLKNAAKLNEIGKVLEEKYNTAYLYSDFKKKEGYKRSTLLSEQYNLYRQDYCGCSYSKRYLKN
ncbi:MAG: hypothetical protein K0S71_2708 [Clostridia bacterium]|jgi:predicted adenine nucleotide alpha hydrolase (AANH) superfamily ATPase|nr:hypothetical protein [Clostridia bacterium]